jgi:phosphoserine phosphatase
MKLQLILADHCSTCTQTHHVWDELSREHGLELEVFTLDQRAGQSLADEHALSTFPALLINGEVKSVGSPTSEAARRLLEPLLARRRP